MASGEVENDNPVILPNSRSGHADPANFLLAHLVDSHQPVVLALVQPLLANPVMQRTPSGGRSDGAGRAGAAAVS